jgi:hypothetical protein
MFARPKWDWYSALFSATSPFLIRPAKYLTISESNLRFPLNPSKPKYQYFDPAFPDRPPFYRSRTWLIQMRIHGWTKRKVSIDWTSANWSIQKVGFRVKCSTLWSHKASWREGRRILRFVRIPEISEALRSESSDQGNQS